MITSKTLLHSTRLNHETLDILVAIRMTPQDHVQQVHMLAPNHSCPFYYKYIYYLLHSSPTLKQTTKQSLLFSLFTVEEAREQHEVFGSFPSNWVDILNREVIILHKGCKSHSFVPLVSFSHSISSPPLRCCKFT